MGRVWRPKMNVLCSNCGWKGVRGVEAKKCPQCAFWYPRATTWVASGLPVERYERKKK